MTIFNRCMLLSSLEKKSIFELVVRFKHARLLKLKGNALENLFILVDLHQISTILYNSLYSNGNA